MKSLEVNGPMLEHAFETDHSRAAHAPFSFMGSARRTCWPLQPDPSSCRNTHCRESQIKAHRIYQVTYYKVYKQQHVYGPPLVIELAAAYARRMFCSLGLFRRVPAPDVVLTFLCGCSLRLENVAARCLSFSAFFKNGLGRFSSSCRSHWTGEDDRTET